MCSKIAIVASVAAATTAQWTFEWPYNSDGSCGCVQRSSEFFAFESEAECLEAFADSPFEYCSYGGRSVNEEQCDATVAVSQGLYNTACEGKCTQLVAGLIETREFFESCDFEFFVEFEDDGSVAVPANSCFNNFVYGWADYDPTNDQQVAPLRIFSDVPSPTRCQELCQNVPECVHFSWRALPNNETEEATFTFQNEPHTCILHSQEYMDNVVAYQVTPPGSLLLPSKYCDVTQLPKCQEETFPRDTYNPFALPQCLLCDCVPRCSWISPVHLSGPAFCESGELVNECAYKRPVWTTTPEPCVTQEDNASEVDRFTSEPATGTELQQLTTEFTPASSLTEETATTILLETTEQIMTSSTLELETLLPPIEELTSTTPSVESASTPSALSGTAVEELTSTTPFDDELASTAFATTEISLAPTGSAASVQTAGVDTSAGSAQTAGLDSSAGPDVTITPVGSVIQASSIVSPTLTAAGSVEPAASSTVQEDGSFTPEGSRMRVSTEISTSSGGAQPVRSSSGVASEAVASSALSATESQILNSSVPLSPSVPADETITPVGSVATLVGSAATSPNQPSVQPPCVDCAEDCVEDCYPNYHYEEEDCMDGC